MAGIKIASEKCAGCGLCVRSCPFRAIEIRDGKAVILDSCTMCASCVSSCKLGSIELQKDGGAPPGDASAYSGVWVFAQQEEGNVASVALELLGAGSRLASELNVPLSAVLLGHNMDNSANTLIRYGADKVYVVDDASLERYNDEVYCDIFVQLIKDYKPEIVLIGATTYGRSLAPRVASRLSTGLTADCTGLSIDSDKKLLLQTRPAFGGNLMATIVCPHRRPQMSTVRPRVMKPLPPDDTRKGEIIRPRVSIKPEPSVKLLAAVKTLAEKVSLAEADIIVAAGRGMGEAKNLRLIEELAGLLGAAVGASRAIVDAGWIDYSYQIGQTGKTVGPKIYIACGISGAIQHQAGMSSSETIIAINKDPDAPIFRLAKIGIVGDVLEVLPAIIDELKSRAG
ncbi:MAG: FAD-binding protein [Oscillospiraceae bacterium]|jgi:electron transfer flavoprotein alpha subunit